VSVFVVGAIGVYEPGVSEPLDERIESLANALCSHVVHHVFILHLLIVGATEVLDTHLFSWNILGSGSPGVLCW